MNRISVYILIVGAALQYVACQQKMVCPAYHSYFILDIEETKNEFSLFGPDSLPKDDWEVHKKKVGIAEELAFNKKWKEMRIISTESIYLPLEDPLDVFRAEYADADSTLSVDTAAYMADYYNDFHNIDQMIYLHHFGKYLPKREYGFQKIEEELVSDEPLVDITGEGEVETKEKKRKFWPFGKKKSKDEALSDSPEDGN
jgi:hypothetical protein